MKKKYQKPLVYMETFELSEHIAGCNLQLTSNDPVQCTASGTISWGDGLFDQSDAWFVDVNTRCTSTTESYCITNSSFNVSTINS